MITEQEAIDFVNTYTSETSKEYWMKRKSFSEEEQKIIRSCELKHQKDSIKKLCSPKNLIKDSLKIEKSPSGKYHLEICEFDTGPSWNVSSCKIFKDGELITEVCRDYSPFPFAWVENHPDGNDYLICSWHYQDQTIIKLNTGERFDSQDGSFCWSKIIPSLCKKYLLVGGFYWACPYELAVFDFSNPTSLPFKELARGDFVNADGVGWNADGSVNYSIEYGFRKSDNKPWTELTEEEEEKAWDENDYIPEIRTWRPEGIIK